MKKTKTSALLGVVALIVAGLALNSHYPTRWRATAQVFAMVQAVK